METEFRRLLEMWHLLNLEFHKIRGLSVELIFVKTIAVS